ncbi:response regulator [Flavobacterium suzhouense]|uniref:Response regulator n=1 Tax=Flavobacterium suzhouense TaxID=1529638 RepID=A0ABW5NSG0_9FLAO
MRTLLKNIFLAEDDTDDVFFFKLALEDISNDCKLTVFPNGQELINRLQETNDAPDILFLDINMPGLNGLETLGLVRELSVFESFPVVICSTSSNEASIRKAKENGAGRYMIKPSDFNKLHDMIERMLTFDWKSHCTLKESEEFVIGG